MATLDRAFPSAETLPLRRVVRRTTVVRIVLAVALVAALALAFLRFFRPDPNSTTGSFPANPWQDFRAGTRISAGLAEAHASLVYAGASKGSILIVSDLEILPDEVGRLGHEVADVRRDGIEVRILAINPTPEKRLLLEQILG